jgi:hypothetical protein
MINHRRNLPDDVHALFVTQPSMSSAPHRREAAWCDVSSVFKTTRKRSFQSSFHSSRATVSAA